MRLKTQKSALAALVASMLTGCELGTGLPASGPPIDITLDFCEDETPIWFAHQNENEPWRLVIPDVQGSFAFSATPRVVIAFVRRVAADYRTEVIFTTNGDLEKISGLTCVEEQGSKQISGTVAGLSGSEVGLATVSMSSAYVTPGQSSFTLAQLPDRPIDVVASRIAVAGETQHANKTVIRRGLNPLTGSTLNSIDFSSEGVQPTQLLASVSDIGSDFAYLVNNFFSQLGTSHVLSSVQPVSEGDVPFVAVPTAAIATGDYHDIFLVASTPNGSVRGVERFFRNAADQVLALKEPLAVPRVSVIATSPHVRMRTQIEGQLDYSTTLVSEYRQITGSGSITLATTVTASFFDGTPGAWSVPTPDFTGMPGYDEFWTLRSGASVDWTVTGYFGRPQLLFGDRPQDGESVWFASRSSSVATAQAALAGRPVNRPIIARWR